MLIFMSDQWHLLLCNDFQYVLCQDWHNCELNSLSPRVIKCHFGLIKVRTELHVSNDKILWVDILPVEVNKTWTNVPNSR